METPVYPAAAKRGMACSMMVCAVSKRATGLGSPISTPTKRSFIFSLEYPLGLGQDDQSAKCPLINIDGRLGDGGRLLSDQHLDLQRVDPIRARHLMGGPSIWMENSMAVVQDARRLR
jgi:hypothetical protein